MTHVFSIILLGLFVTLVLSPCSSPIAAQGSARRRYSGQK